MSRVGKWRVFAQHECLFLCGPIYSGDYIIAGMNLKICPKCGEPCDLNARDTWAKVVRRKVSDSVWYNPTTWKSFHWEYKLRGHLEEGGYNYRKQMRNAAVEAGHAVKNENDNCL